MSDMVGMNVEAVRRIGRELTTQARRLDAVQSQVTRLVQQGGMLWLGTDSDRFASAWSSDHLPRIKDLVAKLDGLAAAARTNADEQDRASSGSGAAATSATVCREPTAQERFDSDYENLQLAEAAERDGSIPGWTLDRVVSSASGFEARIYRDGKGHVRVVYAGTDFGDYLGDDLTDAYGTSGITLQDVEAISLAKSVQASLGPEETMELVGHSLGGRLAALAAIATGNHATTFNAAGPSMAAIAFAERGGRADPLADVANSAVGSFNLRHGVEVAYHGADSYVTNYHMDNDVLSVAQEGSSLPNAVGTQVTLHDNAYSGVLDAGTAHNLFVVEDGMNDYAHKHDLVTPNTVLGDPSAPANLA